MTLSSGAVFQKRHQQKREKFIGSRQWNLKKKTVSSLRLGTGTGNLIYTSFKLELELENLI